MYQYLRACSLIASNGKDGIDLAGMAIHFTVYHRTVQSPSTLTARIYNLKPETMKTVFKEFTQIVLKAGYKNQDGEIFASIFEGYIIQARIGRESPTDTFLDIVAADGEIGYDFAVNVTTLAAGHGPRDIKREINNAWKTQQVEVGYEANMPNIKFPRGRAMFGMTRDYARDLAFTTGHTWSIKHGKYETVPIRGVLPDEEIVLNSQTGLIGLPQHTPDGVTARCLLNPYIEHNKRVQLDNKSIQGLPFPAPVSGAGYVSFAVNSQTGLDPDGHYRVIACDHIGDTRGQAWYTDMWLMSIDLSKYPQSDAVLQMDIGPEGVVNTTPTVQTHGGPNPNLAGMPAAPPGSPGY